jgi:hypothetical protein
MKSIITLEEEKKYIKNGIIYYQNRQLGKYIIAMKEIKIQTIKEIIKEIEKLELRRHLRKIGTPGKTTTIDYYIAWKDIEKLIQKFTGETNEN